MASKVQKFGFYLTFHLGKTTAILFNKGVIS